MKGTRTVDAVAVYSSTEDGMFARLPSCVFGRHGSKTGCGAPNDVFSSSSGPDAEILEGR